MTEIVKYQQPNQIDAYTPTTFDGAMQLARTFAASKLLGGYGSPEQVMLVMATGAELGIPPTAALRGFYLVEGRIYMSSDLMVACCLRSPQCERFELAESTDQVATYEVQRRGGKAQRFSFSAADKARAGLGGAHSKYPAAMLRHRAAAVAARAVFPDVVLGLYVPEEAEDIQRRAPSPAPIVEPLPVVDVGPLEIESWPARFAGAEDSEALAALAAEFDGVKASLPDHVVALARAAYKQRRQALK